jgi:ubiquinone/menaquinone biosynthesis C-methylase UbiE
LVGCDVLVEFKPFMSEFDSVAREWDNKPDLLERSMAIANKMIGALALHPSMTALEFGAGTGILSLLLKDRFSEITMMDSSCEMVKVMEEKVAKGADKHLKPLFFDLEKEAYPLQKVDVIFTQMVMHHVHELNVVLSRFHQMLNKGGQLAIVDLYAEDGSFHGGEFNGHLGFDPEILSASLKAHGFKAIHHEPCYVMQKKTASGIIKDFPLFLLMANRS